MWEGSVRAERFRLGAVEAELSEVTSVTEVVWQGVRFNPARQRWDVELSVRSKASGALRGPLVVLVDSTAGIAGAVDPDGQLGGVTPYFNLALQMTEGRLAAGASTGRRVVAFRPAGGNAVPNLKARVFAAGMGDGLALGWVRVVDESGLPLGGVTVRERGPSGTTDLAVEPTVGAATLGGIPGQHFWEFRAAGRWPAWQRGTLVAGEVLRVMSPRLPLKPAGGIRLAAGATVPVPGTDLDLRSAVAGEVRVTAFDSQTLPAPLPSGWIPLQGGWFETISGASGGVTARGTPWMEIPAGLDVAVLQLDEGTAEWRVRSLGRSLAGQPLEWNVPRNGAWLVVSGDPAPTTPPPAVVGAVLSGATVPAASALGAQGELTPSVVSASTHAPDVTVRATVRLGSGRGTLPSGTALACRVTETYALVDGTVREAPAYTTTLTFHRAPGAGATDPLQANFPLRPTWISGADRLREAMVRVDLLDALSFDGQRLEPGGEIGWGALRVGAAVGVIPGTVAVEGRPLEGAQVPAVPAGAQLVGAFEITVGGLGAGARLDSRIAAPIPDGEYVLARSVPGADWVGWEVIERRRMSGGRWESLEPSDGSGLDGLRGAGQFAWFRVGERLGVVRGIVRNTTGAPVAGARVQIDGQPWVAVSDVEGRYRIVSAGGLRSLTFRDERRAEGVGLAVEVPSGGVLSRDAVVAAEGPRVLSVTPVDGASDVPLLTVVRIRFDRPVATASAPLPVELLDAVGAAVRGAVAWESGGTSLRLTPETVLSAQTAYRVRLAAGLTDAAGRPLAGAREFRFTTVPPAPARLAGAQLYSEAPGADGQARVVATAGFAEGGAAVLFVNDTTGQVITRTAALDGSFSNTIPASVEDRLRVVLLNRNGTRTEVPVGVQRFQDGSVALYAAGGTWTFPESTPELGPITMEVPAGATLGRTRFSVKPRPLAELPALSGGVPPAGGTMLGIVDFSTEGDPLQVPVKLRMTLNQALLDALPRRGGGDTNDPVLVAGIFREMRERLPDGTPTNVVAYQFGGRLQPDVPGGASGPRRGAAPAFLSAGVFILGTENVRAMLFGTVQYQNTELTGLVVSRLGNLSELIHGTDVPLAGAVVRARARSNFNPLPFTLQGGEMFTVSDGNGVYSMLVPAQQVGGHALNATHPQFPGRFASSGAGVRFDPNHPFGGGKIVFDRTPQPDRTPPQINVAQSDPLPAPGNFVRLLVTVLDASGPAAVPGFQPAQVEIESVEPTQAATLLVDRGGGVWELRSDRPARVLLKIRGYDAYMNEAVRRYPVNFGERPAIGPLAGDPFGPRLLYSQPDQDGVGVASDQPIVLQFSEPLAADAPEEAARLFLLTPFGGTPRVIFGRDRSELVMVYPLMAPGLDYTLSIQGIRDAAGQIFDQDPNPSSPAGEPHLLRFSTADERLTTLPGVQEGGGAVIRGGYAYVIDRIGNRVIAYDVSVPYQPSIVGEVALPGRPTALALVPGYDWVKKWEGDSTPGPNPPDTFEHGDLLAVAGTSGAGTGFIRILDLRERLGPESVVGAGGVDLDETARITRITWSAPYLVLAQNTATAPSMRVLHLQTLLLGFAYRDWAAELLRQRQFPILPEDAVPGVDVNGDGDFVDRDEGDQLPLLGRAQLQFTAGEVTLLTLAPNEVAGGDAIRTLQGTSRFLADVVADGGSGFVGALVTGGIDTEVEIFRYVFPTGTNRVQKPAEFRGFLVGQVTPERFRVQFTNVYPKRALRVDVGSRRLVVAGLIGLTDPTNQLAVIDVTFAPQVSLVNEIPLPASTFGLFQGAELDDSGRLVLLTVDSGGREQFAMVDAKRLLEPAPAVGWHPAIQGIQPGVGGGNVPFGVIRAGTAVASLRLRNVVSQTAPLVRWVLSPSEWLNPFSTHDYARRLPEIRSLVEPYEMPVVKPGSNGGLEPAELGRHVYLHAEIPGGAGDEVTMSLMAMTPAGRVVARDAGDQPPAIRNDLRLRRLSDDPRSEAFNVYLSGPVAVVAGKLTAAELTQVQAARARTLITQGSRIRVGFTSEAGGNPVLQPYAGDLASSQLSDTNRTTLTLGSSVSRGTQVLAPELEADEELKIRTVVDRMNTNVCPSGTFLNYGHNLDCRLTLLIDGRVARGVTDDQGTNWPLFENVPSTAGAHRVFLDTGHAGDPGEHTFELRAERFEGWDAATRVVRTGTLEHEVEILERAPVGHTFVQGIDLWDGHLTMARQDFTYAGRRLPLEFTRTYSSAGDSSAGPMGAGWNHSHQIRLIRDDCGRWTVIGGEGGGNVFTQPAIDPAKEALYAPLLPVAVGRFEFFRPQLGFHSVLVRDTDVGTDAWFFTKSAVRYHFVVEPALSSGTALVYVLKEIREPHGNALVYDYTSGDNDRTTLDTVTEIDPAFGSRKRGLQFRYENIDSEKRLRFVDGFDAQTGGDLLGLHLEFEYDADANLRVVTRRGPTPDETRVERYDYTPGSQKTGHNLRVFTDASGHRTEYVYGTLGPSHYVGSSALQPLADVPRHEVVQRVIRHGAAHGEFEGTHDVVSDFGYDWANFERTVSNPRPGLPPTKYRLNTYGATIRTEWPMGKVEEQRWAVDVVDGSVRDAAGNTIRDVVPIYRKDAAGRETFLEYHDGRGNVTRERVVFPTGYAPVRNRSGLVVTSMETRMQCDALFGIVTNRVDAEGFATSKVVDPRFGDVLQEIDELGNVARWSYAPNGNLEFRTDERGFVTRYFDHDLQGNPQRIEAEVERGGRRVETRRTLDIRGRVKGTTDTFGHHTQETYDALDRVIVSERLAYRSSLGGVPAVTRASYHPGGEIRSTTSPLGLVTRTTHDALGQRVREIQFAVSQASGSPQNLTNAWTYDPAGNAVTSTDARGVSRTQVYDDLNRPTETRVTGPHGPVVGRAGVVAERTYDLMDNVRTETDLHGNITTRIHDGLYRVVETRLPFPNAVMTVRLDLLGNAWEQSDANGNLTRNTFDAKRRMTRTIDPLGNATEYGMDAGGHVTNEVRAIAGLTVERRFDGLGRVVFQRQVGAGIPATGYTSATEWNDDRNESIVTNARGRRDRIRKDGLDRIVESEEDLDGLRLLTLTTYDAAGNTLTVRDPEGGDVDVTHRYDELGRRIRSDRVGTPDDGGLPVYSTTTYDNGGLVTETRDPRDVRVRRRHDNLGRLLQAEVQEVITGGGAWLTMTENVWDDPARAVDSYDARRTRTRTESDGLGRPERITDGLGAVARRGHDGVNVRWEINPRGLRTETDYDVLNRVVEVREFEAGGTVATRRRVVIRDDLRQRFDIDRRGFTNIVHFDSLGREIRRERSGPGLLAQYGSDPLLLETREYDGNGNVVRVRDGRGSVSRQDFDGADRRVATVEGEGSPVESITRYGLDGVGNIVTVKDGRAHGGPFDLRREYDARYRVVLSEDAVGGVSRFRHDAGDLVIERREPLGWVTSYAYDELGKLLSVDESARDSGTGDAGVTRFRYDAQRNLLARQDAAGNLTTFVYDALHRMTTTVQHLVVPGPIALTGHAPVAPAGATLAWNYQRDEHGNIRRVIDARGQEAELQYDHLDRLKARTYSNQAEKDANGLLLDHQPISIQYEIDGNGNRNKVLEVKMLTGVVIGERVETEFDALDRPRSIRRTDHDDPVGRLVELRFDVVGNRTRVTDPDGRDTRYSYDARNRMQTAVLEPGGLMATYRYEADGLLARVEYPNGVQSVRTYDAADRMKTVENRNAASIFSRFEYDYDLNGNRTNQLENLPALPQAFLTTRYEYDRLNRLKRVDLSTGGHLEYGYLPNNSRLTEDGEFPLPGNAVSRRYHYAADPARPTVTFTGVNALSRIEDKTPAAAHVDYEYDANLNQVARIAPGGREEYRFDARDQLIRSETKFGVVRYDNDDQRRRIKKRGTTSELRYLHDDGGVLTEHGPASSAFGTVRRYDRGRGLLAISPITSGQPERHWYLHDALGSAVNVVKADGTLQNTYRYDPWGEVTDQNAVLPNQRRFTGQYADAETGLQYFGARYYSGRQGRFVSQDPYQGDDGDPASLNRFGYAHANPTGYIDEDGHSATLVGAALGFAWGVGQAIGGAIDNAIQGKETTLAGMGAVVAQNTIGGLEGGASVDALAMGGVFGMTVSGGLGGAGLDALTFTGQAQTAEQFKHGQEQGFVHGAIGGAVLGVGIPVVGGVARAVAPEMTQLAADGAAWALGKVVGGAQRLITSLPGRRMAQEEVYGAMAQETGAASRESLAAALRAPAGLPTRAATAETTTALTGGRSATVAETLVVERTAIAAPSKYIPYEPVTAVARREASAIVAPSRMMVAEEATVVARLDPFPVRGGGYFDHIRPVTSDRTVVYQMLQRDMAAPEMACVPSCARMVLRRHRVHISVKDLGDAMGTGVNGTNPLRAAEALDGLTMNGRTFSATFEGASSPGALANALRRGDDVIVGVARQFPGESGMSHHAVIVERFDTGRNFVRIRDPGAGVYEVSVREFLERWTRVGIFIR
jgi:RHS repeat-associated protein